MRTPRVIDVYHQERITDLAAAKQVGIWGIIHKATQGTHFKDPKYRSRKNWALENGLLWGAYHFATAQPVERQVKAFLDLVDYDGETLLALDYEPDHKNGTMSISDARKWLEMVYKETGQRPVVYSGHLIKERLKSDPDEFWSKHRLWLAQYGPSAKMPIAWNNYWLWQYTDTGKMVGFKDEIDLNAYGGTEEQLRAEWAPEENNMGESVIGQLIDLAGNALSDAIDWKQAEKDDDLPDTGIADQRTKWIDIAKSLQGTDETPGSRNNSTIMSWAKEIGAKDYTADSIPWCGLFTGYVCGEAGLDIPKTPLWALSWNNWGQNLSKPKYGCIIVFKRNGGGHVGFAVGQDDTYYHVLGGNQSDTVNISKIAKSRCVGWRWPTGYDISLAKDLPYQSIDTSVTQNES